MVAAAKYLIFSFLFEVQIFETNATMMEGFELAF